MPQYVRYAVEDHVATITMDRPEKLNAFNGPMRTETWEAFHRAEDDEDVRAVVLCGTGRAFCAGADLVEFESPNVEQARSGPFWRPVQRDTLWGNWEMTKPVVAAIQGYCVAGGFEIAAFADIRVCSEDAKFGSPQQAFGIGDGYMAALLPRLIGASDAAYYLYTGEIFSGAEAKAMGFVTRLTPDHDSAVVEATAIARRIAANAPMSIQTTKYLANRSRDDLDQVQRLYQEYNRLSLLSEDAKEGNRAFLERRKATFTGR